MKLILLAAAAAASLLAQSNSGTIQGIVRDAQDAVIPGAMVTVTNAANGVAKTIPANAVGEYTAPFLVPGTYTSPPPLPASRKRRRRSPS